MIMFLIVIARYFFCRTSENTTARLTPAVVFCEGLREKRRFEACKSLCKDALFAFAMALIQLAEHPAGVTCCAPFYYLSLRLGMPSLPTVNSALWVPLS